MKYCAQCPNGYPDTLFACPMHGGALHEIRELKPGMVIHKAYRIVRKLGQGGMGIVYLADHIYMQEQRALKFLSWELCQDEAFTNRFRQEVRTLQRIHHRNVVDCGDLEPAEDDSLFFPMEFVDGPDLWDFLRASPMLLEVELALSLSIAITEGLSAAHALGLVHRDIKPENILMASSGEEWIPKIADFGIVAIKESGNTRTRTKTGASLLTMEYAAPEQWRGTRANELDGRTDIYALGGMIFEMLTGKPAFEAESYEGWAECHKNSIPKRPSELRPELAEWPGLDELVLQMLAKDREQRPANTAEVLRRLREIHHVAGSAPAGLPVGRSASRPASRNDTLIETPAENGPANQFAFPQAPPPLKSPTGPREEEYSGRESAFAPAPFDFESGADPALTNADGSRHADDGGWSSVHGTSRGSGQALETGLPQGAGLMSSQTGNAHSGSSLPPKQGKWRIPLAVAAMALFAAGGLIYYLHETRKQPADQTTQYVPADPQSDQHTTPSTPQPVATPSRKTSVPPPTTTATAKPSSAASTEDKPKETDKQTTESLTDKVNRGQKLYKAKQYAEAAPLFEEGCDGGNSLACNQLGYLYEEGLGVEKTPAKAITLYTKGCDMDNEVACFNLGGMYSQGIGVKQDYAKAVSLYSKSCDAGDATACNSLGVMYQSAHGVTQDNAKAATLFTKACAGKEAAACSNLGEAYMDGAGVTKDTDKGKEYLNKGCSMGDQWGCDKLKALK